MRPATLRGRLTLWYTAVLAGLLAAFGATALALLDRALLANVDASLATVARTIAESSVAERGSDLAAVLDALLGPMLPRSFALLDPLGRPDPRLPGRPDAALPLTTTALENAARGEATYETLRLPGVGPDPVRMLTLPVVDRERIVHLVQAALPLDAVEAARVRFVWILLGLAPVALAGAALGGRLLATRAFAPVDALVDAAHRIGAEDLSRRLVAGDAGDEIERLAAVLNDMLARLERSFSAVRRFSADAAHELKTPLTILKGEIEVALRTARDPEDYRRGLASCAEEVDRLTALVEDLLLLARADAGAAELPAAPVDLAAVLADAAPGLRALAEPAGVTLSLAPASPVWVRGREPLLFRVVFNLGDNAIKYSGRGARVTITLASRDGQAVLAVCDDGPGIAPGERTRIFEPFYRSESRGAPRNDPLDTRAGTGLGLAVVRSIVVLHRGGIDVEGAPGTGTCFRVRLPLAEH